jgi:hypothetical protein
MNQWKVVVGQPKWDVWKNMDRKPNLSIIGTEVVILLKQLSTRAMAREEAKKCSDTNIYWHYRVEKVVK